MKTLLKPTLLLCVTVLTSCGSFYKNPTSTEPAAIFIERSERQGLFWYRKFTVSEIDGMPVSHMGASGDANEIRVHAGTRRIRVDVDYLGGEGLKMADGCQCRATFPLDLNAKPGAIYKIGGTVQGNHKVTLELLDVSNPVAPPTRIEAFGRPVLKNTTFSVPGGAFITIPSK